MRNLVLLFLLALLCHSSKSLFWGPCKTKENVMNCTGMRLTDCPPVKKQITNLILDNNFIKNFTTIKCQKWNRLEYVSIRNNQLEEINLNSFSELVKTDLSNNSLVKINLKCQFLTTLIANSNQLSDYSLNGLVRDIHSTPLINNLDLSNNLISKLSIQFLTLKTNSLLSLNFSGNKLSKIDLSLFNKQNLSIDLSNNKIIEFIAYEINNIFKLDLSNNQLTKINGEQMNNFINLKSIDLSNNPLSCFCNESKSFIEWIIKHKSLVVNSEYTLCKTPIKLLIFNVICPGSSTTYSSNPLPTTTSMIPTNQSSTRKSSITTHNSSTNKSPGTTHYSSTKKSSSTAHNKSPGTTHYSSTKKSSSTTHNSSTSTVKPKFPAWKIVLAVIIPLAVILAIIACYFWFCRKKNKYQRLDR